MDAEEQSNAYGQAILSPRIHDVQLCIGASSRENASLLSGIGSQRRNDGRSLAEHYARKPQRPNCGVHSLIPLTLRALNAVVVSGLSDPVRERSRSDLLAGNRAAFVIGKRPILNRDERTAGQHQGTKNHCFSHGTLPVVISTPLDHNLESSLFISCGATRDVEPRLKATLTEVTSVTLCASAPSLCQRNPAQRSRP